MNQIALRGLGLSLVVATGLGSGCGSDTFEQIQNEAPTAVIAGDARFVTAGVELALDGRDSRDDDGTINGYDWDFGDGVTLNAGGPQVTHIYNVVGTYTVTLVVTDNDGDASDPASVQIEVTAAAQNQPPTVELWGATVNVLPPGVIQSGVTVTFTGVANDSDGVVATWSFNYGDGTPEDEGVVQQNDNRLVSHTFANPTTADLTYVVTLSVTDEDGANASASRSITVQPDTTTTTTDYSGNWIWQLAAGEPIDPSGIGGCAFQDSILAIVADDNAGTITIDEMVNNSSAASYSGTLTGTTFSATHQGMLISETIAGDFDTPTSFTGTYSINAGGLLPACEAPRVVTGVKQ